MVNLKYLVTGTGKCGTVFMARFLTSLGIPCGHESIFDWKGYKWAEKRLASKERIELSNTSKSSYDGINCKDIEKWIDINELEAESSYMAAPFLGRDILKDVTIIHIVRNPIKVVNSFCNYIDYFKSKESTNPYEKFIYRLLPELQEEMPQYDRACLFYVRWNQMIEKHNVFFHKIENNPDTLFDFLGTSGNYFNDTSINTQRKQCKYKFSSANQIETKEIRDEFVEMGSCYGYNMYLNNKIRFI